LRVQRGKGEKKREAADQVSHIFVNSF
jgi:hypothetical protein